MNENNQQLLLFGIGINKFDVINWEEKKPKLLELLKFDNDPRNECQTDYFQYNTRPPYLRDWVDIMKEDIDNLVEEFTQGLSEKYQGDCPVRPLDQWQLWSQRYTTGEFHGAHNHGMMNISCILYVEFDENEHEPTAFYSPFPHPYFGTIGKACPPVKEGTIIAFPSILLHECPVSKSKVPRTIMSFNIPLQ
tara:strand:- start:1115 stop:1690 length:576 start_codon:yes stop_codon:yes gene_type:complete